MFVYLAVQAMTKADFYIRSAREKFDSKGNLTDEKTRELLYTSLEALVKWTLRLNPALSR